MSSPPILMIRSWMGCPVSTLLLFNKPYDLLSQFTSQSGQQNLSAYLHDFPGFYPAGRLDRDSEGLLLLTPDGALQNRIASPRHKLPKTYWVQVEGDPTEEELAALTRGVSLNDGPAKAKLARRIDPPTLWQRNPDVKPRAGRGTRWIEIVLTEGRNRQVRRMTAAIGYPTLRLVRWKIGTWCLDDLQPGQWRKLEVHLPRNAGPKRAPVSRSRRK